MSSAARRIRSEAIVGHVYEAAVAPDGLQRIAEIAMKVAGGGSVQIGVVRNDGMREAATCNLPPEALENYAVYYRRINPFVPIAFARGLLHMARTSDLLSDASLRRTEFYTDFLRRFDTVRMVGTPRMALAPDLSLEIGVHRSVGSREFSDRDVGRLQRLAPHLGRALQLRHRLGVMHHPDIGTSVLDTLAFGCVVCDGAGRVLFANRAAEALELAGVITLAALRQGIGAPDAAQSRKLGALIGETAAGGSGGAIALTAGNGVRLFALVTPLPRRIAWYPAYVLVTLQSEASAPPFNVVSLRALFGLTPAEARLALALAAGRSIAEVGTALRVSENTLRTQIASVLRKTATANQRELVRILNLPPPLRGLQQTPR
ncbi:MAG: helix-turn-helix transcriptional regulator [Lautropia sp.]